MNISRKRQSQFELFPGASKSSLETGKSASLTKDLTLSLENIIVLCIIFVMSLVLFFSFGVEKGRRAAVVPDGVHSAPETKKVILDSSASGTKKIHEESVVFPIDVPKGLTEDSDATPRQMQDDDQERIFTIQVASFKLRKNAQREADHLKSIGHEDVFVIAKGSYSIVCVGKFAQRVEAKKFSSKLSNRYNDFLVRRL